MATVLDHVCLLGGGAIRAPSIGPMETNSDLKTAFHSTFFHFGSLPSAWSLGPLQFRAIGYASLARVLVVILQLLKSCQVNPFSTLALCLSPFPPRASQGAWHDSRAGRLELSNSMPWGSTRLQGLRTLTPDPFQTLDRYRRPAGQLVPPGCGLIPWYFYTYVRLHLSSSK